MELRRPYPPPILDCGDCCSTFITVFTGGAVEEGPLGTDEVVLALLR